MKTGLDILVEEDFRRIKGMRLGLVANQSSVTSDLRYSFEMLTRSKNVKLVVLFSPEHGFYGADQDMVPVKDGMFEGAGEQRPIPVRSLYGKSERSLGPSKKDIASLDSLIFDIQDIGTRYYTFIHTMAYCMEACAAEGKPLIVLDRPNPINGTTVEGPVLRKDYASFVGRFSIPVRHGMTYGELAIFFNEFHGIGCSLNVVKMKGWKRQLWFDDTRLPWIPPSPNMPSIQSATVYPGTCLLEGTNLSEGRGTTKPFEYVGAPWIEPHDFADALNDEKLPGATFRPLKFTPAFHKWKGNACGGVHLFVTDRRRFKPFLSGVAIVRAALMLYPAAFRWREETYEFVKDKPAFDLLAGSDRLRKQLESHAPLRAIESSWKSELEEFKKIRKQYLLY